MFLKRIVMQGFKSFADKTAIDFDEPVTGIVGPNGCGKSNIADAIRWVLGEQSAKSLRGTNMTDVIFSGSNTRKAVNTAEVTLVMDNHDHVLPTSYEELEITRRLHRVDNSSEYLINGQPCRLKDIIDLTLDTGLGRESLGIITQGNVQTFADAKPEDRRTFFEEAAGVAKYKKRKKESEAALERTQDNLSRVSDILGEIERQVEPLRRQAKKAESYSRKKEELEKIEVAVLVAEIHQLDEKISASDTKIREREAEQVLADTRIQELERQTQQLRNDSRALDFAIGGLQEQLIRINDSITSEERKRAGIEEKRKYQEEHAGDTERITRMRERYQEAKFAYEDQKKRYDARRQQFDAAVQAERQAESALSSASEELDRCRQMLQAQKNRASVVRAQIESPFQYQQGVQAIVSARDGLPGILDVVAEAIHPKEGYETAVSTAIAGGMYHIITIDEASARGAIRFLKRNRSGRATFLPLSVIRPRSVPSDVLVIAENTEGYLGVARDFAEYDPKYESIAANMLGNTLVADTLETANELARRIRYSCRIVTLEGDVVNRGGSMTGGIAKNTYSPMTLQKDLREIEQKIAQTEQQVSRQEQRVSGLSEKQASLSDEVLTARIDCARLETAARSARDDYESAKTDYEEIDPEADREASGESAYSALAARLNELYARRDSVTTEIRLKNEKRTKDTQEIAEREEKVREIRRTLSQSQMQDSDLSAEKARAQTQKENDLLRLNTEYQMTLEHAEKLSFDLNMEEARQRVLMLRSQIKNLGTINPDAPAQYEEINKRYTTLKSQYDELVSSKEKLLAAIREMDEVMKEKFSDTFNRINQALPEIFVKLFGGGKARLIMQQPEDILNTGIDIDVQPPGKNIQNIRLFSGGEKSLIAICVLFAILKVRPVPLCLFDEVESALDTANVDRFARYLKEFSSTTQFIVVTHRTGTMEQCDVLYGVTMPQQGISQMLRVKLSEARQLAEKNQEQDKEAS